MLAEILSDDAEITVVDMEAGLEHLSRSGGTLKNVDHLLVMVEPYTKAIDTAKRSAHLARELGIAQVHAVGSKVRGPDELALIQKACVESDLDLIAVVPYDDSVRIADRDGRPPLEAEPNSQMVQAVERLAERLLA
jgi:CO dehydrogenase maturation factor